MFNPLVIPHSWDDLFLPEKAMVRTSALWVCLLSVAYPAILAIGLALRLGFSGDSIAVVLLVCIPGVLIYFLWLFLDFVNSLRELIDYVPKEQAALLLRTGRTVTRLFYSLMFAVGTALVIGRLWMLPPAR